MISPIQVQHLALHVVGLQEIPTDPLLEPVRDGISSLMTWLDVFSKLTEGVLNPTATHIIKDIEPLPYGQRLMGSPIPEEHHLLLIPFQH